MVNAIPAPMIPEEGDGTTYKMKAVIMFWASHRSILRSLLKWGPVNGGGLRLSDWKAKFSKLSK